MLGQLTAEEGWGGRAERGELYGLPVLRTRANWEGFWGEGRLRRAGRALRRGGAMRALVPRDFGRWDVLGRCGLVPVDPGPFLRGQSLPLTLRALERRGLAPDRATVSLRGARADREMAREAVRLCSRVRRLVIDAPRGGEELAKWLRWQLGVPILPRGEQGELALRFDPEGRAGEEPALELYGQTPALEGMALTAPGLEEEDRGDLALLAALWEGGRLGSSQIKIT